jgi:gliding motility-associated-like protein/uncharacterized repeat protein (TIGR01451 family)
MKRSLLLFITTVTLLFSFPLVNYGQAPDLGTAADFALFTTVGAVTNAGTLYLTQVTGNVGSNIGPISGFGNVDGQLHAGDGASALASADLLLAYGQLASAIPNFFPSPLLGNGATLPPGVYSIGGPTTLNLNLTLDGQNDPNAVFIFQIQGSFGVNANSKVILINQAQACNVFWKVEGAVGMATNSTLRGTIVANNAAITTSAGDTIEGRALSINGAVGVTGTMIYTPLGCGTPILTGPASPPLLSIGCYTIFSSDGPVTNAGITNIIGDVGSNNGLTSGFDPLLVVGAIHPVPDGSTVQAASDLLNVYSIINAMPYDIELMRPDLLGHNLVLTPHTYIMNAAAALTDTFYLNAQGNANAVFVIKTYGALSTNNYSKVILQNGTQSQNVYWMVAGAVSITDFSEFVGTIISTGALDLTTGVILDGRALTTVGAINTSAITANMPPGCFVASPPVITIEPADQIGCVGSPVSFSVTATGDGLTYQWRRESTNLIDGSSISGATTSILTIDPVSISDAATDYNVVVSGTIPPPATSINVSLTVDAVTNITSEPVNQIACVGDSVSFTVAAIGTGLSYQWRKGIVDIIGATNDTLTIDPVAMTDAALNYNVVVMGTCSNDTSINASLSVNPVTLITSEPVDQTACVGDSISFTVAATGNGLTFQWRKGIINIVGATNDTLTIDPVALTDAALNYNVVVMGICSNDTSVNASLTVNTATVITTQPLDQTVCVGDSMSFTVAATGNGLAFQWRKGIVNIIGATNDTLTIDPVTLTDVASDYNVVITGTCSNITSTNASLSVNTATIILTEPVNQTICAGDSVSFFVLASGSGLTYQWRKGIVNLIDGANISGATNDTLTIDPATITDIASNYNVVITGGCSPINTLDVNLNSAGNFGILAGTAITSTGFSEIHDVDVGLSPGVRSSITGFPPAIVVNGAIYASDDIAPPGVAAMLIQAKQDLTDAYLFAEGATSPAPATVAGDQGGLTLAPGIYKSTSTLLIQSGDLTLDAQGDANAVWIFQIASDLTTVGGAGGNVILSGGAQAKNITWQVGSSATIGNGTSFKGNILALTSITMNTTATIDGRLLARNGAVVLSGTNSINKPNDALPPGNSISSTNVSLTVNPLTEATIFTSGATIVCQNSPDETYLATATNSTSVIYTVLPVTSGVIDPNTGVMNWDIAFSGNATITATATGLCGTTSANRVVLVNPSTGPTIFVSGATTVCQNDPDETYLATATNSTSVIYTVLPVTSGVIDPNTGVMNWDMAFSGNATITATATGLCGTTSANRVVLVNPSTGPTIFVSGATTVCQNDPDETYFATATNSTSMIYTVLPVTSGVIDPNTGVMNWDMAFSGNATITATATGLCGTTSAIRVVLVNPSTGPTIFVSGATTVCQNDPDETYLATATNGTSTTYAVSPTEAGVMNATTGVMNWDAMFSGNATITAYSGGLCGSTSADLLVVVNPSTGPTSFTSGATTICQNAQDETYSATANNSTSTTYSVLPIESGVINATSGVMNWDEAFYGIATITAYSSGLCGSTSADLLVTVNPSTGVTTFTEGATSLCQDAVDEKYTAIAANSNSMVYSVLPINAGIISPTSGMMNWNAAFFGNAVITATATGLCGISSAELEISVNPSTGPTIFTGGSSSICQNSINEIYSASAENSTSILYAVSPSAAGTINSVTGEMNWDPAFNGEAIITANATGLCGTSSANLLVTVTPSTEATTFVSGALVVCQDSENETYIAVSVGATVSYTVLPVSAGLIDSNTGEMDWDANFSGEATITATSIGLCGTTSAELLVTVNPSTGATNFMTGALTLCQDAADETYIAAATNSNSITYSVLPASAGIINANNGVMNWNADFTGIATITAIATGLCGTTSASLPVTISPATGATIFIAGALSLCQDAMDETYNANATNSTSIIYSVLPATAGLIDANTGLMNWDADFSGTAIITATSFGLCASTSADRLVQINPTPTAIANSNSPVCEGDAIYLSSQTVSGGAYEWTGPDGFSSDVQNPEILSATPANAGEYILRVYTNGCASEAVSVTMLVNNCANSDLGVVKTADNQYPLVSKNIIFSIVATNYGPFEVTGVTMTDILENGYTYISSTATIGIYNESTGVWNIGSMLNGKSETLTITAKVNTNGNYINTATISGIEPDSNLANNISTIEPEPRDFFIPEGYSPNSDGINDLFVIRGILYYPENTFVIFNRWGNKVFETSHYQNTWDGKSSMGLTIGGDELPVGTYFYLLDLGDGSEVIKGTIYLNR